MQTMWSDPEREDSRNANKTGPSSRNENILKLAYTELGTRDSLFDKGMTQKQSGFEAGGSKLNEPRRTRNFYRALPTDSDEDTWENVLG
jgi:predicted lactoylglutathione lyase